MSKIKPEDVKGLPKGARILHDKYVYFGYNYRRQDGTSTQERDYLGTVSDNLEFVPNEYYLLKQPVKEQRPLENWTNPEAKEKARAKLERQKLDTDKLDVPAEQEMAAGAGITALAVKMLYDTGMVDDVGNGVFGGDVESTMHALNLAIYSAITSKPTYLADAEADIQKFIGTGCLSSPRASEFYKHIGKDTTLSIKIGKVRSQRINGSDLLALDGTKINCRSKNIGISAVGKDKHGTFSEQINFSMLINASNGEPLGYRYYAGNTPDVKTLADFRAIWNDINITDKNATLLLDRGYFCQSELIDLAKDNIRFIVGTKTSLNAIKAIIDNDNHLFFSPLSLIGSKRCYGLKRSIVLRDSSQSTPVNAYVYRDPRSEMDSIISLRKRLDEFAEKFDPERDGDDERLAFFHPYEKGCPLKLNEKYFEYYCYSLGFFAFVSNCPLTVEDALSRYGFRNEAECAFKLMLGHIMRTTRVHSSAALDGVLFTTFIGLGLLSHIRGLLDRPDAAGVPLKSTYTIAEVLKTLQRITLVKNEHNRCLLLNVTAKDKKLVAALGYEGLLDSAEEVNKLLSARYLQQYLQTQK